MVHQERGCYHVLVRSTTIMLTLSTATGGVDFLSPVPQTVQSAEMH